MSDEGTVLTGEARRQAVMAKIRRDLIELFIWGAIGWCPFIYAVGNYSLGMISLLFIFGGILIGTRPVRKGGFGSFFFWRDYEIITTYSDGTKTSDHGAQSSAFALGYWALMLIIGGFVTLGKIVYLIIRYVINYLAAEKKPPILKSAFPIIIVGWVVFIALTTVFVRLGQYHSWADVRERNAEQAALNAAADIVQLNVPADNGVPMKISEIRYRSDATVVVIMETEEGAVMPLVYTGFPDSRYDYYQTKITTAFKITAPSGEYNSTGFHGINDSKLKRDVGVEILFPVEFTDSSFTMTETSMIAPEPRDKDHPPANPVIFTNVSVNKEQ